MKEETTNIDIISDEMLKLGHKSTLSDIRGIVRLIEKFSLINEEVIKDVQVLITENPYKPSNALVRLANKFIYGMMEEGLLIRPFLEAVQAYPNNNSQIQYETVNRAKKYGYYDQRIGHDISAAMRNFTSMLNLTTPSPKRGQYELTELGEKVVEGEKTTFERVKCDVGEPCREECPTGAIRAYRINLNMYLLRFVC